MKRRVVLAVLFSFLVPGLGQIYNEDLTKGLLFLLASIVGFFFGLVYILIWLWAMIDAYVRARAITSGDQSA